MLERANESANRLCDLTCSIGTLDHLFVYTRLQQLTDELRALHKRSEQLFWEVQKKMSRQQARLGPSSDNKRRKTVKDLFMKKMVLHRRLRVSYLNRASEIKRLCSALRCEDSPMRDLYRMVGVSLMR